MWRLACGLKPGLAAQGEMPLIPVFCVRLTHETVEGKQRLRHSHDVISPSFRHGHQQPLVVVVGCCSWLLLFLVLFLVFGCCLCFFWLVGWLIGYQADHLRAKACGRMSAQARGRIRDVEREL